MRCGEPVTDTVWVPAALPLGSHPHFLKHSLLPLPPLSYTLYLSYILLDLMTYFIRDIKGWFLLCLMTKHIIFVMIICRLIFCKRHQCLFHSLLFVCKVVSATLTWLCGRECVNILLNVTDCTDLISFTYTLKEMLFSNDVLVVGLDF